MPRVIDKENRRLSHAHKVRLSDDEETAFAAFLAAHDLTAQDCIRGLINRKLWISNDGLAARVGNMRAERKLSQWKRLN